ncbi:MAG: ABC transporter ATP-binding protein [Pedobacter sp.]|nr:MAG: ABC transporter ATP-binding protein [Pedobacter sp.]
MKEMLNIKNLSAGYPKKRIFEHFNVTDIDAGNIVALVGPNAAGKSTLLKAVASLIQVQGEINLGNENLVQLSQENRSKIVGYMPQHQKTDVELTVLEALITALKVSPLDHNDNSEQTRIKAFDVLEQMDLIDIALEPLANLSGGQRQMASLAQAIVRKPQVLLLDEPTSALDLNHQITVMKMIRDYAAKGNIVIMVLHDLNLASRWADILVVLSNAKIYSSGKAFAVVTPTMLKEVYQVEARVENCSNGHLQIMVDA